MKADTPHEAQAGIAGKWRRSGHHVDKIILAKVEAVIGLRHGFGSIIEFSKASVVIIGGVTRQFHDRRSVGTLPQTGEDEFAIGKLIHVVAKGEEMARHLRVRHSIGQITETRAHEKKTL